jgi:hypothetical protein
MKGKLLRKLDDLKFEKRYWRNLIEFIFKVKLLLLKNVKSIWLEGQSIISI